MFVRYWRCIHESSSFMNELSYVSNSLVISLYDCCNVSSYCFDFDMLFHVI